MRYKDIRRYLKPYSMVASRATTINHAFAACIAPCDKYDEEVMRKAIIALGQDPDSDLLCVYCGDEAETWDHIHATVREKKFSGHGHRIGNLLPCCKTCNSKKGNKPKLGDHHRFPRQHSGLRLPLFSSPPIAACFIFRVSGSEEAFDREEEASDPTLSSRPARRPTSSFSPFSSF